MRLFVDMSVWYAAADTDDRSNGRAREILSAGERLVTTDHVLLETWTLLRWRIHRPAAERFWNGIRRGAAVMVRLGQERAASFDPDFRVFRFGRRRERAFDVVG